MDPLFRCGQGDVSLEPHLSAHMFARLAATLLIATVATPSSVPVPPQTITDIRVFHLCAALRRLVRPAVGRIMQDDNVTTRSISYFNDREQLRTAWVSSTASRHGQRGPDARCPQQLLLLRLQRNTRDGEESRKSTITCQAGQHRNAQN